MNRDARGRLKERCEGTESPSRHSLPPSHLASAPPPCWGWSPGRLNITNRWKSSLNRFRFKAIQWSLANTCQRLWKNAKPCEHVMNIYIYIYILLLRSILDVGRPTDQSQQEGGWCRVGIATAWAARVPLVETKTKFESAFVRAGSIPKSSSWFVGALPWLKNNFLELLVSIPHSHVAILIDIDFVCKILSYWWIVNTFQITIFQNQNVRFPRFSNSQQAHFPNMT